VQVLIVSWEFPPLVVGGLGRHVAALARELDAAGHDVRVLTRGIASTQQTDQYGRVRVIRAAVDPIAVDFGTECVLAWAQTFEHPLTRAGLELVADWHPHVIHAHDWLVAQTSRTLHQVTGAPVVAIPVAFPISLNLASPVNTSRPRTRARSQMPWGGSCPTRPGPRGWPRQRSDSPLRNTAGVQFPAR
jgi:glycogen(starch) synthase